MTDNQKSLSDTTPRVLPLREDGSVVSWRDCPQCKGRGWFLKNAFFTTLTPGRGNMLQCGSCQRAYDQRIDSWRTRTMPRHQSMSDNQNDRSQTTRKKQTGPAEPGPARRSVGTPLSDESRGPHVVPKPAAFKGAHSNYPTHEAATRIAAEARRMGFTVRRSAASPMWRTAYVFCNGIKVRIADHPNQEMPDIDVHVDEPRPGSVDCDKAIEWLRGRL